MYAGVTGVFVVVVCFVFCFALFVFLKSTAITIQIACDVTWHTSKKDMFLSSVVYQCSSLSSVISN